MHVLVIPLPELLPHDSLADRAVVVIDVLRATTTIACALEAGAHEVRVFARLASASAAFGRFAGPKLLAGERDCHKPPGFDLGNSPLDMTAQRVGGRTLFMSTTNGTRAIQAAQAHPALLPTSAAPACFAAALVNAQATARHLARERRDLLLLCAGSDAELAEEDLVGAGALMDALEREGASITCPDDAEARHWFERFGRDPIAVLRQSRGGVKLLGAGMGADIAACARLNAAPVVCAIDPNQRIRKLAEQPD